MWIAVQGCAHGELEKIYDSIEEANKRHKDQFGEGGIQLLICCGDFQSIRNAGADFESIACPRKYREMGSFYKYYSGEKEVPVPTLFIGGNHEASSHLFEVRHGGWVAPNMYFLGHAGVVWFGGLRIAGISGIFKKYDFCNGRYECPPFDKDAARTVYHQRELDVLRLAQIDGSLDVFLSHDWPLGVTRFGDEAQLLRKKKHFADDIRTNQLGSPPCQFLMNHLKPKYYFSAHLHCKFAAVVPHGEGQTTKFLALDKVLPNRDFLQFLDMPVDQEAVERTGGGVGGLHFSYDPQWLAILRETNGLTVTMKRRVQLPPFQNITVSPEKVQWAADRLKELYGDVNKRETATSAEAGDEAGDAGREVSFRIPQDLFHRTQPAHNPGGQAPPIPREKTGYPQMEALFSLLDIRDPFAGPARQPAPVVAPVANPDEIDLGDDDDEEDEEDE